uniref:J domain-containing protein n=1 Tax=Aegilops tauschii subsp. strangulata TaxID=200361 RepID=A0A452XFN3_AEGTS
RQPHPHNTSSSIQGKGCIAMAGCGGGLYAVLGVSSDCSDAELRSAYRKLAMKWHPDKCGGGSEAAKARFHKIQAAYAVLSDPNKRILYDVGAYDSDADDEGAGDILGDILEAMNHTPPHAHSRITEKLHSVQLGNLRWAQSTNQWLCYNY